MSASSEYAAAQRNLLLGAISTIPKVKQEVEKAKKEKPKKKDK